ncbi:alpha/beta fold hydrolase [Rhizobium sp. BK650]|uniref:alpha/beta fold hydrolase n=1 Tax=Rhizobium sp. BK650 TaxID=2586990 RepID=UPI003917EDB7
MLNPDLARFMYARSNATVVEIEASHVPHLSHPQAVADVISAAVDRRAISNETRHHAHPKVP